MGVYSGVQYKVREGRQLTGVAKHKQEGEHRDKPPGHQQQAVGMSHWAAGYLVAPDDVKDSPAPSTGIH
jgi:hypothetical protein